jgi:hypothetical protein
MPLRFIEVSAVGSPLMVAEKYPRSERGTSDIVEPGADPEPS